MHKDDLGGEALKNGLFYYGLTHKVIGTKIKGQPHFKVKKMPKSRKCFTNTPILRGIMAVWLLSFAYYIFITNPKHMVFGIEIALRTLMFAGVAIGISYIFFRSVREYHGAEHIVANAFLNNEDLTDIELLRNYSTQSIRCGSAFVILFILISIVVSLIIMALPESKHIVGFAALLTVGITYEIHSLNETLWITKPLIRLSLSIQKHLLVAPPTDEKLLLASQTLLKLIELEEK